MQIPQMRRAVAVVALAALSGLLGVGCGSDGPTSAGPPAAAVRITAAPSDGVLLVGASTTLGASVTSATGSTLSRVVQWSTSNGAIASVSAAGGLLGVAAGPVLVIARVDAVADTILVSVRVPIPMTPAGAAAPVTTAVLGGAVSLTVPPAAGSATQLTVAPAALLPDDDRLLAGAAFDFGPSGTTFSTPVTMSLRYTPAAVPAAKRARLRIHRVEDDGSLTLLEGSVDEASALVSAQVSSFSTYALVVPADVATLTAIDGDQQSGFVNGELQGLTVLARDAQERPVPLVEIGFSIATGNGSIIGATTALTDANGVATLPGSWRLGPAKGQQTLHATQVGTPRRVTFTATATAVATTLRIEDGAPDSAFSGIALPNGVGVQVLDDFGDPVTEIGRVVRATLVEGTGTLLGDTIQAAPTGTAIFQTLRIAGSGPHRIAFTSGTLVPDTTASIAVTQQLGSLAILTQPGGAASGVPFSTQPVIELRDNAGLRMVGATTEVVASAVHGPGAPFGGLRAAAVDGVATFSGLAIDGEGSQRLRFSVGFIDVISDEFTVGPPPPGIWLRIGPMPAIDLNLGQGYGPDLAVDLSNRGTANIRRLQLELTWDPSRMDWAGGVPLPWSDSSGTSATVTVDESRIAEGVLIVTGETPLATLQSFTLFRTGFLVRADSPVGPTTIGATILDARDDAGATVPVNIRPLAVTIVNPNP